MSSPQLRGYDPPPLPNEVVALAWLFSTLTFIGYFVFKIQRDGFTSIRKSALFMFALQLAMAAYSAVRW